jgi:small subunit ribosomal protein S8e
VRKSIENLATSKITGGRRIPLRTRRKYEIDRYPNEALTGKQVTITRNVRGKNKKTALKTIDFVNLAIPNTSFRKFN